jgi:hypothetical protein
MVRTGGILAFVLIVVAIIGAFLGHNSRAVAIVFGLIQTAIIIFVFWSTKGLFNSRSHHGADVAIVGLIVILALLWIFSLIGGAGLGAVTNPQALQSALGVIGIISLIVMLLMLIFFLWFSIGAIGFGGAGGGGLWKAIGILYVIGLALMILTVIIGVIAAMTHTTNLLGLSGILALIGALVWLAAWICHGIGLIMGAGQMQQA